MAGKHISLLVHFVWSTSDREPWITHDMTDELYKYIGGVFRNKKASLLAAGCMSDHVHLYASLPSTISLAEAVNAVKANSSRWIHEEFRNRKGFAWQEGYGAFSVSKSSEENVIRYIEHQEEHHRRRDFKSEFVELLDRHEIEYDKRYIWK
ncbi:MAG TPA: IS200/IS605 family transposase [Blastocatellia bacterium]|nr:IS200/IS605 family transposase [Blastocatellia bacterium]